MTRYDDHREWPGTSPPMEGAPARPTGSVRRTTNIDLVRPGGLTGPLHVLGAGRDLVTGVDGDVRVAAEATTEVEIDYLGGRRVTAVRSHPDVPGLGALVGVSAGSGFRRELGAALPDLVVSGSLVHLLLDETTPGTLISGSVLAREGLIKIADHRAGSRAPVDICAGWQAGGTLLDAVAETGVPLLGWGPLAPDLTSADDALAWHPMDPLPAASLRRRRLIDVGPLGADGSVGVSVRYRDSYGEADGTETVVHEYRLAATVDPVEWRITMAMAMPGPLPAPECPSAAASASRLVGLQLGRVRGVVRDEFTGTTTCTHLNDVFRSLADVDHLWSLSAVDQEVHL